ncbi:MAG: nuclease-related domain-containing protein [Ilumatobacter sp.]
MSGGTTESDPAIGVLHRTVERWESDAERRVGVMAALDRLPVGFVVFHDVALPNPSRAVVDHVVVGPRSIWAVTTVTYSEPIEVGRGRGADTLWAGRTPLRSVLEACEADAGTVGALIGRAVEPLLCVDAPSTPDPAFDFHGLSVCIPRALVEQVGVTTTDFHDVAAVSADMQRVFSTSPSGQATLPTLGSPTTNPRHVRPVGPWAAAIGALELVRRRLPARRVVPIVAIVALLTVLPNVVGLGTSAAQKGVEKGVESVTGVLTPSTLVSQAAGNDSAMASLSPPPDVWYVVTCPEAGAGWLVRWVWPGDLPAPATGYGIATRTADGVLTDHTDTGWSTPTAVPAPVRLFAFDNVTVITEYRDEDGATIASTDEPFRRPPSAC